MVIPVFHRTFASLCLYYLILKITNPIISILTYPGYSYFILDNLMLCGLFYNPIIQIKSNTSIPPAGFVKGVKEKLYYTHTAQQTTTHFLLTKTNKKCILKQITNTDGA